jgi:uncharacterized membrane protein YqjE
MIAGNNHNSPGLATLLGRLARVALGGVHTRVELLAVEWQEERLRLSEFFLWALALLLLGIMGGLLLTATIIFLFPESARIYVTAAFAVLYLLGAAATCFALKAVLRREPFSESIDQVEKDRLWLESLK